MGWLSSFVSDPLGTVGDTVDKVVSNPIPAITAAATGNPTALLAYAAPSGSAAQGQVNSGLLGGLGSYLQGNTTQAANQQAAQATQFRPVGMTTNFGTSNFTIDPTTGQLTSAGYTLNPTLQGLQTDVLGGLRTGLNTAGQLQGLGQGYLTGNIGAPVTQAGLGYLNQSPQQAAAQWMQGQQALLAPSRELAWAKLGQGNYNQGTTGLRVAQGGGLQAANPYASALANAQAQQDVALAAQAQQQGLAQQQAGASLYGTGLGLTQAGQQFGQGLLSSAYQPLTAGLSTAGAIEGLGQQPLELSSSLAGRSATAGTNAANYLKQASSYNPTASILSGLGQNTNLTSALSGLFGGGNNNSIFNTSSWMPTSTFDGYGGNIEADIASWLG